LKLVSRNAAIKVGEQRQKRLDRELTRGDLKDPKEEKARREQRLEERKRWDKERDQLLEKAEEAEIRAQDARYWYAWGMMVGFFFVAGGAVGFLHPRQPRSRRVLGCIVLAAQVLLIFIGFQIGSTFFALGR